MRKNAVVILFNKPYGVLTQFTDSQDRETLKKYIPIPDIYPAGRLDRNSEGLLILTNDGALSHRLTDPLHHFPKTYLVQVEGEVTPEALSNLERGVVIQGHRTRRSEVLVVPEPDLPPRSVPVTPHGQVGWLRLVIHEGKKHQIRHMTAAVNLPTLRLIRVAIGPFSLGNLKPGEWRILSSLESKQIG